MSASSWCSSLSLSLPLQNPLIHFVLKSIPFTPFSLQLEDLERHGEHWSFSSRKKEEEQFDFGHSSTFRSSPCSPSLSFIVLQVKSVNRNMQLNYYLFLLLVVSHDDAPSPSSPFLAVPVDRVPDSPALFNCLNGGEAVSSRGTTTTTSTSPADADAAIRRDPETC